MLPQPYLQSTGVEKKKKKKKQKKDEELTEEERKQQEEARECSAAAGRAARMPVSSRPTVRARAAAPPLPLLLHVHRGGAVGRHLLDRLLARVLSAAPGSLLTPG